MYFNVRMCWKSNNVNRNEDSCCSPITLTLVSKLQKRVTGIEPYRLNAPPKHTGRPQVRSYLAWIYLKRLRYLAVQLLDVGEALDPPGGAAVGQLRVEHQFGPQVGRWRREPRAVHGRLIQGPGTCVSAADLLVLHQLLLGRLVFLPPSSQRHILYLFPCSGLFLDVWKLAATTLKWLTCGVLQRRSCSPNLLPSPFSPFLPSYLPSFLPSAYTSPPLTCPPLSFDFVPRRGVARRFSGE